QPVTKTDNDDEHKKAVEQAILATAPPQNCNAAKMQQKKEKHSKMSYLSRSSRRQNNSANLDSIPTKRSEPKKSTQKYEVVSQPNTCHTMYAEPPIAVPDLMTPYQNMETYYPDAYNTDTSNDSVLSLPHQFHYQHQT